MDASYKSSVTNKFQKKKNKTLAKTTLVKGFFWSFFSFFFFFLMAALVAYGSS